MRHRACQLVVLFSLLCVFSWMGLLYSWHSVQAQGILPGETADEPKERSATVTATVPDIIPPTAPVLIAPENGSAHTQTPSFSWQASTDEIGVVGYDMYLDGEVWLSDLGVDSESTASYALVYDGLSDSFTLTLSNNLADGTHTWKIVAKDLADNQTSSTTWSFSQDTQAPTFVIDTIDSISVAISATDPSTVPSSTLTITNNEPVLTGHGEANSTFVLRVVRQENQAQVDELTGSIDGTGAWSLHLNTLPRDVTLELNFTITDAFGLVSTLNHVLIRLPSPVVVVEVPVVGEVVVPATPPQEIISTTVRELQLAVYTDLQTQLEFIIEPVLPILEPIKQPVAETLTVLTSTSAEHAKVLSPLWYTHLLALLALILLPLLKTVLIVLPQSRAISLSTLLEVFRVVGLWPDHRPPAGICVQSDTLEPLAGAIITYVDVDNHTVLAHVVSDNRGYFAYTGVTSSQLDCTINSQRLAWLSRPPVLKPLDWYEGEVVTWEKVKAAGGLVVPVAANQRHNLRQHILTKPKYPFLSLLLAVLVTIITPTVGNLLVTTIAVTLWTYLRIEKARKSIRVSVYYKSLDVANRSIVRINHADTPGLYHTNKTGQVEPRVANGTLIAQAFEAQHHYAIPADLTIKNNWSNAQIDLIIED